MLLDSVAACFVCELKEQAWLNDLQVRFTRRRNEGSGLGGLLVPLDEFVLTHFIVDTYTFREIPFE